MYLLWIFLTRKERQKRKRDEEEWSRRVNRKITEERDTVHKKIESADKSNKELFALFNNLIGMSSEYVTFHSTALLTKQLQCVLFCPRDRGCWDAKWWKIELHWRTSWLPVQHRGYKYFQLIHSVHHWPFRYWNTPSPHHSNDQWSNEARTFLPFPTWTSHRGGWMGISWCPCFLFIWRDHTKNREHRMLGPSWSWLTCSVVETKILFHLTPSSYVLNLSTVPT